MKKAILAGINVNQTEAEFTEAIEECINLCEACQIEVIGQCIQKSRSIDKKTAFRSGKLEELHQMVEDKEADCVVFYNNLSVAMLTRIFEECGVDIIDRTTLILDIFSLRAQTKEAKLQTQMARLKYSLPKLLLQEVEVDRQRGGGVNNRGSGESRIEEAKRNIKQQISEVAKQLEEVQLHNELHNASRNKSNLKKVALVGYTNAGKSSLMNALLERCNRDEEKKVMQKDMLFATLDTSIRNIKENGKEFLLYDTVGFVSDLPHELVEAFKSTLDAAREADLLIHVIDASNPKHLQQKEVTLDTLKEIKADQIPLIEVFNKVDLIEEELPGLNISCKTKEGLDSLLEKIFHSLYPNQKTLRYKLPYSQLGLLDKYRKFVDLRILEENEDGYILELSGSEEYLKHFQKFEIATATHKRLTGEDVDMLTCDSWEKDMNE